MIQYQTDLTGISPEMLRGFFVGWPNPPSSDTHFRILENSSRIVVALDDVSGRVVGFINAISDGILSAYLPLLEVLPEYQDRGIGGELVRRMLERLKGLYMVDLTCDEDLQAWYSRFGLKQAGAMMIRNFSAQSGCIEGDQ